MQQAPTPNESNSTGSALEATARLAPTDKDIVFGRGKKYQDHEGNRRMRECVNEYKQLYDALKRFQKQALVENIYEKLKAGGARFLRKDEATDSWVLVERELAIQKVSHALRCKKHLGKPSSPKKIQDAKNKKSSSRRDSSSTIETTDSTRAQMDNSSKKEVAVASPASAEVGRVSPDVSSSVLSAKTVAAAKPSLPAMAASAHMGGSSFPPSIANLQVLQTLRMQDMLYQQQMLAMVNLQRQAQQQAYYNAAMSQLLGIQKSAE